MRISRFPLALMAASLISLSACHKQQDQSTTTDDADETSTATSYAMIEKSDADVETIADQAADAGKLGSYRLAGSLSSGCATVTRDTVSNPRTITIDFGTANCTCSDGRNRRGRIVVSYSGRYHDSGSVRTIRFDNYFVNDNQRTGVKTVTNNGRNSAGQEYMHVSVSDSLILAGGEGVVIWKSERVRTLTDATHRSVTGTGTFTRANGRRFSLTITNPLTVATDCRWIESGKVEVTPAGGAARTIDFGSGNCDSEATLTVGSKTRTITLR